MATRLGALAVWAGIVGGVAGAASAFCYECRDAPPCFPACLGAGGSVFAFRVVGVSALIGCCCKEGSARMLMFIAVLRELVHTRTG